MMMVVILRQVQHKLTTYRTDEKGRDKDAAYRTGRFRKESPFFCLFAKNGRILCLERERMLDDEGRQSRRVEGTLLRVNKQKFKPINERKETKQWEKQQELLRNSAGRLDR